MIDDDIRTLYDRIEVPLVKHPKSDQYMLILSRFEMQFIQHFLRQCIINSHTQGCNQ